MSQTLAKDTSKTFPHADSLQVGPISPNPQIPPCHLMPKPWSNPQKSLKLFSHNHRIEEYIPTDEESKVAAGSRLWLAQ